MSWYRYICVVILLYTINGCIADTDISHPTHTLPLYTSNPNIHKDEYSSILSLSTPTSAFSIHTTWTHPHASTYTLNIPIYITKHASIGPFMITIAGDIATKYIYTYDDVMKLPRDTWYVLTHDIIIPHGVINIPIHIKSGTIYDHMSQHQHQYDGWKFDNVQFKHIQNIHIPSIIIISPTYDTTIISESLIITYKMIDINMNDVKSISYTLDHHHEISYIPIHQQPKNDEYSIRLYNITSGQHMIYIHIHDITGHILCTSRPTTFIYHGIPTPITSLNIDDISYTSIEISWNYTSIAYDMTSFDIDIAYEYDNHTLSTWKHITTIHAIDGKWDAIYHIIHYSYTLTNLNVATRYHISIQVHRQHMISSYHTIATRTKGVIRRNVRDISEQERIKYAHDLLTINNNGMWVKLAQIHVVSANYDLHGNSSTPDEIQIAHKGSAFLPWHRAFLLEMESHLMSLQSPDSPYGLLYWSWHDTNDRNDTRLSPDIFTSSFIGGDGIYDHTTYNNETILKYQPGYRVTDGVMQGCKFDDSKYSSFNPSQPHLSISSPCTISSTHRPPWYALFESKTSPISHDPWGITRAAATTVIDHTWLGIKSDIDKIMEMTVFDEGTYSSVEEKQWQVCLKDEKIPHKSGCPPNDEIPEIPNPAIHGYGTSFRPGLEHYHNMIHRYIAGSMFTGASANDPLFYLHHANIDMLYDTWIQRHHSPYDLNDLNMDWSATRPRTSHYPYPSGGSDAMWPWMSLDIAENFLRADPAHDNNVTMKDVISAIRQPGKIITPNQVHVPVQQLGYRYAYEWKSEWVNEVQRPTTEMLSIKNKDGQHGWKHWKLSENVIIGPNMIQSGNIIQNLHHATYISYASYTLYVNITTIGRASIALLAYENNKPYTMCTSHHNNINNNQVVTCTIDIYSSHRYIYSHIGVSITSYDMNPVYIHDVYITANDVNSVKTQISTSYPSIEHPSIITSASTPTSTTTSPSTSSTIELNQSTFIIMMISMMILILTASYIGYRIGTYINQKTFIQQQLETLQTSLL